MRCAVDGSPGYTRESLAEAPLGLAYAAGALALAPFALVAILVPEGVLRTALELVAPEGGEDRGPHRARHPETGSRDERKREKTWAPTDTSTRAETGR